MSGRQISCRCGEWFPLPPRGEGLPRDYLTAWREQHTGPGHRDAIDEYRMPCRPEGVCRNCGAAPSGQKQFYCSEACRDAFDENHFWQSARWACWKRYAVYDIEASDRSRHWDARDQDGRWHRLAGIACAACGDLMPWGAPEVNHRQPVNGERDNCSCHHHQENLEPLHHACHVEITIAQRDAGLIGPPTSPEAIRRRERRKAQQVMPL